MSGFGTAVIEDVDVLIKLMMASKAGLYKEVSGSCRDYKHRTAKPIFAAAERANKPVFALRACPVHF